MVICTVSRHSVSTHSASDHTIPRHSVLLHDGSFRLGGPNAARLRRQLIGHTGGKAVAVRSRRGRWHAPIGIVVLLQRRQLQLAAMWREVLAVGSAKAARRQAAVHHIAFVGLQCQLQLVLNVDGLPARGAHAAAHRGVDTIGIALLISSIVVPQVTSIRTHNRSSDLFRSGRDVNNQLYMGR